MNGGIVTACVGLALLLGACGAYVLLHELRPPPKPEVIRVQVPTQPQVPPPPNSFGPVPNVVVQSIPAPTPAAPIPAASPAPVVVERPVVKHKAPVKKRVTRKTKVQRKLEQRWSNVKR